MSIAPESKKHLSDIMTAIEAIEQYTQGLDLVTFTAQGMVQAAVERKFEIIGEALKRMQRTDPQALGQIVDYKRIIGFRNILAHGYDIIDHELIWDIIENHLTRGRLGRQGPSTVTYKWP